MKRYIVDKKAVDILLTRTLDAQTELGSSKIITDEPLEFSRLPFISIVLSDEQVELLKTNGLNPTEEVISDNCALARPPGYEKIRSAWYKTQKRAVTGAGVKVGVLDSGCNLVAAPFDFTISFIDDSDGEDVYNHGSLVSSILKNPDIALCPGCILYNVKILSDTGNITESALLAAFDYAIENELDIINCSWVFGSTNVRAAIEEVLNAGIVVSGATGNSTTITNVVPPATYPGVIAVNAIDADNNAPFKNVNVDSNCEGCHGVTIACNGWGAQAYANNGVYTGCWGTSCAAPFFTGGFALYKEALKEPDNYKVVEYMLYRARKQEDSLMFGVGTVSF